MAIRKVARMGHPVLRQVARELKREEILSPQFRDFIQNDTSHKKWIVIRAEKIQTLRTKFLRELDNKLSSKPEIINEYIQNKKKEEILSNKIGDYQMQVHRLSAKISDLRDRRKDINLDLGIVD